MRAHWFTQCVSFLHIMHYMNWTLFPGFQFSSHSSLELRNYSDANWAEDPINHWSTIGYCFLLGTSLISWIVRSNNQYVLLLALVQNLIAMRHDRQKMVSILLLLKLHLSFSSYIGVWQIWVLSQTTCSSIYCDSCTVIHMDLNNVSP